LPPYATDDCYRLAFEEFVVPLAGSFNPDIIVLQAGADANHADPLTSMGMTLGGFLQLTGDICALSDDLCDGRLAASGGGGYAFCTVVPLAWTTLFANLMDIELPEKLPASWAPDCSGAGDVSVPETLSRHDTFALSDADARRTFEATREVVAAARRTLGAYHDLA
jgi:acetoin utilization protein AcuC